MFIFSLLQDYPFILVIQAFLFPCGTIGFRRYVGMRVGVAHCWNKLALRNLHMHPSFVALKDSEISAFIRTDGHG